MNELISLLPSGGISRFVWDLVWQSTLIGMVALVSLRFFVRHPAARAWFVVLATGLCVAIPLVSVVVRANGLGLLSSAPQLVAAEKSTFAQPSHSVVTAPSEAVIGDGTRVSEHFADAKDKALAVVLMAREPLHPSASSPGPVSFDKAWVWTGGVVIAIVGWAVFSAIGLIRLIGGLASVCRLCREAVACDNIMILGSCRRAAQAIGLRREPQVAISPETGCPTVLGWGRPKVFIPPLASHKTAHQWFSVFTHELAHVQRGDGWAKLAMEIAAVLLPWQPLIRVLQSVHRQACEEACDDWALFAGADPVDFASTLTEWIPSEPTVWALDIGIGTSSIRQRIERLLRCSSTPQPRLGGGWLLGSGTGAACVLCLLALMQTGTAKTRASDQSNTTELSAPLATDRTARGNSETVSPAEIRRHAPRQLVAVLGDGRMQHWNSAEVLGFGPQHQSLFSYGLDGTLKVWDLESGNELRGLDLPPSATGYRWWKWELEVRRQYYIDLLLSPDGNVVFLGKADGTVDLLDAATFKLQRTLTIPGELPKKLAISADGKRLAAIRLTTADSACAAVVLDIATGQAVGSIKCEIPNELLGTVSAPWRCLALSPDGSKLAVSRNGDGTLWDVASGTLLREFGGGWNLCFSPDGNTLVACSPDQQLQLWDVATGRLRSSIRSFATRSQFAFDPSGDLLAIADGSRVRLCRAETGEQLWMSPTYRISRHFTQPTIAFHKEGQLLVTSVGHGVVLFEIATGQEIDRDNSATIMSLAVDPTGGRVATGASNGQLATWNIANGEKRQTWRGHELGISPLAFSPDGRTLASAAFEHLVVWNARNGKLEHTLQARQAQRGSNPVPLQIEFTPDSRNLFVGFRAGELAKWDIGNGNREGMLQMSQDLQTNYPFAMTRDNQLIAYSRGERRGLGIWDLETGKQTESLARYSGQVEFAVSRDGRIAAGERGDKISVWDQQQKNRIDIVKGHRPGYLRALALSPNGQTLASGADDGKVQLWNAASGDRLDTLQVGPRRGIIDQLAFSVDGSYLMSKNGNGTVSVFQVGPVLLAKD